MREKITDCQELLRREKNKERSMEELLYIREIRKKKDLPVTEIDDEINRRNNEISDDSSDDSSDLSEHHWR